MAGGGLDVLLSRPAASARPAAIGLDITTEMRTHARDHAIQTRATNVEFLAGRSGKAECLAGALTQTDYGSLLGGCRVHRRGDPSDASGRDSLRVLHSDHVSSPSGARTSPKGWSAPEFLPDIGL